MDFDMAPPRVSLRAVVFAVLAVPLAVVVVVGLGRYGGRRGIVANILSVVVLVLGTALLAELVLRAFWLWKRSANAERLRRVRQVHPDALYVGIAQTSGFVMTGAGPSGLGVITLARSGISFRSSPERESDGVLDLGWADVRSVQFHPTLQIAGRLRLGLRDGRTLSWWIRDNCIDTFDTLSAIRDAH